MVSDSLAFRPAFQRSGFDTANDDERTVSEPHPKNGALRLAGAGTRTDRRLCMWSPRITAPLLRSHIDVMACHTHRASSSSQCRFKQMHMHAVLLNLMPREKKNRNATNAPFPPPQTTSRDPLPLPISPANYKFIVTVILLLCTNKQGGNP